MKKSVFQQIVNLVNGLPVEDMESLRDAVNTEWQSLSDKRTMKNAEYETAKPIVFNTIAQATSPITISEIYEGCRDSLPEGFTRGKIQYAMRELWKDEIVRHDGKVGTYSLK